MRHLGIHVGAWWIANYLHSSLKSVKEESATIIGAFPYLRAVAAPMLLPQTATLNPFSYSFLTTEDT